MSTIAEPPVAGLPEGVELIGLSVAGPEDYEIVSELQPDGTQTKRIYQGPHAGASSGVLVKPKEGYSFRYDIRTLSYVVVKQIPPLTIKHSISFSVSTDFDRDTITATLDRLRELPGFVIME